MTLHEGCGKSLGFCIVSFIYSSYPFSPPSLYFLSLERWILSSSLINLDLPNHINLDIFGPTIGIRAHGVCFLDFCGSNHVLKLFLYPYFSDLKFFFLSFLGNNFIAALYIFVYPNGQNKSLVFFYMVHKAGFLGFFKPTLSVLCNIRFVTCFSTIHE